jgi:hypothetical protein
MSYSTYAYIGWYVVATPTDKRIQVGETKVRVCSADPKHKHGDKGFCGACGAQIISTTKPKMQGIGLACHFFNESDPEELAFASVGNATVEDMKALGDCHAVFPEFLPNEYKNGFIPGKRKEVIMAPGYTRISDLRHGDSSVTQLTNMERPSVEWVDLVQKVLGSTDIELKYGVIIEVV